MNKNFYYRMLLVATLIVGGLFICSIPEMSVTFDWVFLGVTFLFLYWVCRKTYGELPQERINEILYLDFFKKIGCDFSNE